MIFRRKNPLVVAHARLVMAFATYHDTGKLVWPNSVFTPTIKRMINDAVQVFAGVETTHEMRARICELFDEEFRRFGLIPKTQTAPSMLGRLCMTYVVTQCDVRHLSFTEPWGE